MSLIQKSKEPARDGLSLYEFYSKTFEIVQANTTELREECFRLRYNVYCLENPFEPKNDEEMERDEYDDEAVSFLLRHKSSGLFVGTTRVIRADPTAAHSSHGVPPAFNLAAKHGITLPSEYTPESAIEVSRFSISKTFRKRADDTQYPKTYLAQELENDKARIIPCMTLGMIAAIYQLLVREDTEYVCVVMTAHLARLLKILGICFHPAGEAIEYHGTRQIFTLTRSEFIQSVSALRPEIVEILSDGGKYTFSTQRAAW